MIKIENVVTPSPEQWMSIILGIRNAMNSWEKSDSCCQSDCDSTKLIIGSNDRKLMMRLCNAGTDHRKFMRMITVHLDITAPLYFWKEFDTYKVGTVANSCSTMHRIHAKEFELDDFSYEHLMSGSKLNLRMTVDVLNDARERFIETNDKAYWWQLIQLLPSSYNQKRTVMLNYEVLANICKSRRNHKLDEWRAFCDWIMTLPHARELFGEEGADGTRGGN